MTGFHVAKAILVLGTDIDDVLSHVTTDRKLLAHRGLGAHVTIVWPGQFARIADSDPFDELIVTVPMMAHEDVLRRDNYIAACQTRVRGADGLTPCERSAARSE